MDYWLPESARREPSAVFSPLALACCLLAALLFLLPLSGLAFTAQVRPIRSVKIIDRDEVGLPIRFPASLAYDPLEDEIYVASPLKNKLVVLTADYFPYLSIGPGRGLESISGSFLKDGNLYVCSAASPSEPRPHIAIYDSAFLPQKKIYFADLDNFTPLDLVVGATGNFYVVGFNGTGVVVLDPDGNYLRTIEPRDEVLGVKEKAPILALDVGQDGKLYFVSEAMGRVYVYDQSERFLYKFGEKGGEPGKLSRPRGIAVDDFRRQVYLVDYQRHTVPVYAMSGEYLFEIGGMGEGRGWFYYPNDVLVDGRGRILVADTFNHRIQVFEFVGGPAPVYGRPDELLASAGAVPTDGQEPVPEQERVAIAHIDIELPDEVAGDYLVLTAISRDAATAEQIAAKLLADGLPVHIVTLDKGKRGIWHQVLVGPYEDPLDAWQVADMLRSEEQLPAILKTRGAARELQVPLVDGEPLIESPAIAAPLVTASKLAAEPSSTAVSAAPLPSAASGVATATVPLVAADVALPKASDYRQYRFPTVEEILEGESVDFKLPADPVHRSFYAAPLAVPPVLAVSAAQPFSASQPGKAASTVDFCVACHDQRLAKVCMQCHPRLRKDRI